MIFLIFLLGICYCSGGPLPPFNLQCDQNLVGLSKQQLERIASIHHFATDSSEPTLSWIIDHTDREPRQTGFRVVVSKDASFKDIYWDTGLIANDTKQEITYYGPALEGGTVYLWKVTWWDGDGVAVTSEEIGHFLAVTLTDSDWANAYWISAPAGIDTAPTFAKNISVDKAVSKATLYISGLSFFRAIVNGVDLHKRADPPIYLAPEWPNYEVRVAYTTFDVSELMNANEVPILITLGEGWRNTSQFPPKDTFPEPDPIPCVLRLILTVQFKGETNPTVIYSDDSWIVMSSKFGSNSIYNGEVYNAKTVPTIVGKAVKTKGPSGTMYLPLIPYIAETGIDKAVTVVVDPQSPDDHYKQVIDFGYNTAGIVNIKVDEVKPDEVMQIKHAEVQVHPPNGKKDGSLYFANLRSAQQLDCYTSNGKESVYQPSFTYHGFRYALVTNYPRKLLPTDLYKVRVNTNVKPNSNFSVSNQLLNNIQKNVIRAHQSNFMSVITGCDQRDERVGWMGDAGLSADSMALNFHMESYFPHRALLMKDELGSDGSIPDVVPFYHGGSRPSDPSWGAAYPQTVYTLWKYYGDTNTAKAHLNGLLRYINFVESQVPSVGIGGLQGRYGDWVPPPPSKKIANTFPSAFSLMKNIKQVMEMATALGDTENANKLKNMFDKHATDFNKAFYQNYTYLSDLQTSYTLPLELDIVPANDKEKVVTNFLNRITADKSHVTSGIIGIKSILPVLSKIKEQDLAVSIATQVDYPSWGYMIHNPNEPATALWELWNTDTGGSGMNSRNHHMLSSISSWMQTDMIGLQQQESSYGYRELDLYPASSLEISHASIRLEHPKLIKYSWHRKGGIQCGKAAEDQSVINPTLPRHGGLKIQCGEGAVSKVIFASYGTPSGTCGYHHVGSCHSSLSREIVEKLCMNTTECLIPTGLDFWDDPCPGLTKWLMVAVICSNNVSTINDGKYTTLTVNLSVPIGSTAQLHIPSYGKSSLKIWDGHNLVYDKNILLKSKGVSSINWTHAGNDLLLKLNSGNYNFTIKGTPSHENRFVNSTSDANFATLRCSSGSIITHIDWASYGNPVLNDYGELMVGTCHSGLSRRVVEESCVGRNNCVISMNEKFGTLPCAGNKWNLFVKYSCNKR